MELSHIAARSGPLSGFLKQELDMSTGLINRLKRQGALRVNGQIVFTNYPVQPGDTVTVCLDEPSPEYPAEDGPLTVLYEDAWLLAVDKPAGMLIHPSHCRNSGTLANRVAGYYARTGQQSAFHPVTRLDRDTFGIVLIAKSSHMHSRLQAQQPRKCYQALVCGQPESSGVIDAPIARQEMPSLLRCVSPAGKPSRTEYRVLRRFRDYALVELTPITGRTHQLRVHCAHIGHPIVGDPQYGNSRAQVPGVTHQLLCASSIAFRHPITGQELMLRSQTDALAVFCPE